MENKTTLRKILSYAIFYLAAFLFTLIAYLIFKPMYEVGGIRRGVISQAFTMLMILVTVSVAFVLKLKNKLNFEMIILFMIIISFLIRVGYMLNTPYNCRQYDTVSTNMNGHEAYSWIIYTTGQLPTHNGYQFYHPPLNASIQALFMHISKPFLELANIISGQVLYDTTDMHTLYQTNQILSIMYSLIITTTSYNIFKELKIKGKGLFISLAFICFFPRFFQLSGQLNNDLICVMLSFVSIYLSIKWWKTKKIGYIIGLAFSIGLAMNSKLSGATICITPAFIFIYEFVKSIKNKDKKTFLNLVLQYVIFLLICAPIGLWFQVYAYIRFDQPFAYVFDNLNHNLSVADKNIFERFINLFDFNEIFYDLFAHAFDNYNLFNYGIKSAILGEFSYWQGEGFAVIAILCGFILVFLLTGVSIYYFIKSKKENFDGKVVALTIVFTQIIAYLYFNIKMPYGCTMDFRYIVPIVLGIALLIGFVINKLDEIKKSTLSKVVTYILIIFLVSSASFYLVCI